MARPIIVPLDGSRQAEAAVPHAVELARRTGTTLHLVRVHVPVLAYAASESPIAIPDPAWDAQIHDTALQQLTAAAAEIRSRVPVPVTFELRVGTPADEVIASATEHDAIAIVCTTHGHGGWAPQWLGSVTDGIVRHAPCPVLAMSEAAVMRTPAFSRILVPLDGGTTADQVLPVVQQLALAHDSTVDLFRVVAPPWVGDALNAVQSGRIDPFGVDPFADQAKHELERVAEDLVYHGIHATSTVEVATSPVRAILDRITSTNPDLVAMTTHGRGLSRIFVGSVTDKVLRAGGRPVLCWHPAHEPAAPVEVPMFATAVSAPTA